MSFKDPMNLFMNGKKRDKILVFFFSNIALKKTFIKSEQSQQYTLRLASFFLSSSWRSSGCCSWWWSVVLALLSFQNMVHLLPLFFTGGGQSTARIASSNTVFRPRWVSAEHSKYFTAPGKKKSESILSRKQDHYALTLALHMGRIFFLNGQLSS